MSGDYGRESQEALRAQVRAELGAEGWNLADLQRASEMHFSTVSRYFGATADRDIPFVVVGTVAEALGMQVCELTARAERRRTGEATI
ncbi:helix-turn-helix domain-containing protein [Sinomonas soli]